MSKASAIREMSDEQLQHELRETQQSLFRLRVKAATERNDVPSNARKLRRESLGSQRSFVSVNLASLDLVSLR